MTNKQKQNFNGQAHFHDTVKPVISLILIFSALLPFSPHRNS